MTSSGMVAPIAAARAWVLSAPVGTSGRSPLPRSSAGALTRSTISSRAPTTSEPGGATVMISQFAPTSRLGTSG